jgi:arylamine N-acetyltransferase
VVIRQGAAAVKGQRQGMWRADHQGEDRVCVSSARLTEQGKGESEFRWALAQVHTRADEAGTTKGQYVLAE